MIADGPGMVFIQPEDQAHAPDTFVVNGDRVTIDDRLHRQLVAYQDGRRVGTVAAPGIKIQDMAIRGDHYYLLEADQRTIREYALDESGSLHAAKVFPMAEDVALIGWEGDSLVAQLLERNRWVPVAGPSPAIVNPTFNLKDGAFEIKDGQLRILIPTRWEPIGIELVAREGSFTYYKVTDSYTRAGQEQVYPTYIYQFDPVGQLVHTYTLAPAKEYRPAREVQIDQGRVYQLYITTKGAQVLLLSPNS